MKTKVDFIINASLQYSFEAISAITETKNDGNTYDR